jgi:hypothetical protein
MNPAVSFGRPVIGCGCTLKTAPASPLPPSTSDTKRGFRRGTRARLPFDASDIEEGICCEAADETVFSIDRSLGIDPIRSRVIEAGLAVDIHDDHFARDEGSRLAPG